MAGGGLPTVRLNGAQIISFQDLIPDILLSVRAAPSDIPHTGPSLSFSEALASVGLGALFGVGGGSDAHLLGQHTVRMSPISTANLNPYGQTFCIAHPGQHVLVPVLLNNTNPTSIKYSLTPLGYREDAAGHDNAKAVGKVERVELGAKELKAIEHARQEALQVARSVASAKRNSEDYDEYDDDEDDEVLHIPGTQDLQKSQSLVHIRLSKPGVLRLDRVLDASNVEARLVYPGEVAIVPCPRASFAPVSALGEGQNVRCAVPWLSSGSGENLDLNIDVFGVPPLSLRWQRSVNGRTEPFMVEGIEGDDHVHTGSSDSRRYASAGYRAAQQLSIPLTVTLDALGKHTYVLESVTDALGNMVSAGATGVDGPSLGNFNETTRSVDVLRRPAVAFKHCGPGNPTSLLIGSEAQLAVVAKEADVLDAPWEVDVKYHPLEQQDGKKSKLKPWKKTISTSGDRKELAIQANAPGEYTITHVKGRYCEGDVLSPDVCKVVERPLPTAEIEWKKIHECSGDIGVSASLVMHGTPPFQVFYSMQRDDESAHELVKTFGTSRGEFTIQPDRSGHYTFTFLSISDANYKRVALKGPSVDQIVHPMASADFVYNASGGRARKKISNCEGKEVDVEVELKGTGPWNLEVQVVGPKGSEIVKIPKITTNRKTVSIPIPAAVDQEGGSFEVDLGMWTCLCSFKLLTVVALRSERRGRLRLQATPLCTWCSCQCPTGEGDVKSHSTFNKNLTVCLAYSEVLRCG